jgi:hypothetical protein
MTRRITHLIEEKENKSKLFHTKEPNVEVARVLEGPQKAEVLSPDKDEVLSKNPRK